MIPGGRDLVLGGNTGRATKASSVGNLFHRTSPPLVQDGSLVRVGHTWREKGQDRGREGVREGRIE